MMLRTFAVLASLVFFASLPASAQILDKVESACASTKLKATGKKVNAKLKCEAKAIQKEQPAADPECLSKAEAVFLQAFTKAEAKGGCVSEGDAASVEANVDELVDDEIVRQRTGVGPLPTCINLGGSCGTCGTGICIPHESGPVCVATVGAVPSCSNDTQCTIEQICYTAASVCVTPCP